MNTGNTISWRRLREAVLARLKGLNPRSELMGKLLLIFGSAALLTIVIAAVAWMSFTEVVGTQARIVDEAIPTMETVQRLSANSARIAALSERLPLVTGIDEARRTTASLAERLQEMRATLDRFDQRHVDAAQGAVLRSTAQSIDTTLREQSVQAIRRIEMEQLERAALSRQQAAVQSLLGLAESLVANASATTTTNIANLYLLIDLGDRRAELLDSLDRLIEVDVDTMERMSEFQLLCVHLKTLLEQLEGEQDPQAIAGIAGQYQAHLATLKRRVDDLRDPNLKKAGLAHYRTLEAAVQDGGVFALHRNWLAQKESLRQLRTRGAQLVLQLNQQSSALVASGGKTLDLAGRQARGAVQRGLFGFLAVAVLLFVALIATLWVVYRYHLLGRLSGMEKAVRALSTGNYDVDIATSGNDPLAPLGRALEQIRENVRERERLEQELRRHQEELEAQVADRTAELKHSNTLLEHEVAEHAQARKEAEEANKAKNLFLGSLSHELRTPLSGVSGAARLLRETALNARQLEYVNLIGYANSTLLEILEDMLSFSRIEAGKLDLQYEPFNLRQLLDDMLSLYSVQALGKGIALVRDVEAAVPAFVVGDRGKINQLLLNMIGNAIKFTDEGAVTVFVGKAEQEPDGKTRLLFSVSDTGIGIPAEKISEVFKPFFQVEDTAHQRHGGAGLGLAICQRLVQAMGGRISIESREGQGTCIAFQLAFETLDALPEPGLTEMPPDACAAHALTVLVVEDDDINRLVCTRYLELLGHASLAAADGEEALELLARPARQIDVILMDISLPGMSGLEVAATIRALPEGRWKRIPIIIMSAHVSAQTSASLVHSDYAAFLSKPFSLAALGKALNGVADTSSDAETPAQGTGAPAALLDIRFLAAEVEALGAPTLSELARLFRDDLASALAQIDGLFQAQDWQALGARAHRLRSAAGNLGMTQVAAHTRAIENAACGEPAARGTLPALLDALKADGVRSCEQLQEWLLAVQDRDSPR